MTMMTMTMTTMMMMMVMMMMIWFFGWWRYDDRSWIVRIDEKFMSRYWVLGQNVATRSSRISQVGIDSTIPTIPRAQPGPTGRFFHLRQRTLGKSWVVRQVAKGREGAGKGLMASMVLDARHQEEVQIMQNTGFSRYEVFLENVWLKQSIFCEAIEVKEIVITLCLTSSINPHGRKMACAWHCCCACRQFCPSPLTPIGDRRAVKTVPRKPPMKLLYLEFLHGEVVDPFPLALALQVPAGCIAIGPARLCHCPLRCLLEDGAKQRCNHQIIRVGGQELGWWFPMFILRKDDLWRASRAKIGWPLLRVADS